MDNEPTPYDQWLANLKPVGPMITMRVVQREGVDEDHFGRQTWILDTEKSGNRAPFRPDDLVVRDGDFVNRVIEVVSGYTKTSWLGLKVKRADLVLDKDAF